MDTLYVRNNEFHNLQQNLDWKNIWLQRKGNTKIPQNIYIYIYIYIYLYILRGFRKLVITFFPVKNTPKLINQQLKNGVKIVNWKKKISYYFFTVKNTPT